MPTFTPRLAVVLAALSPLGTLPLAAQGTPAMATVYLKEGGVIHGQILSENDPNGVRIKSQKSGTTFLLKTVWIDSIVKAPSAPAVQAAAPAVAAPAAQAAAAPKPVAATSASYAPALPASAVTTSAPAPSAPAPSAPLPARPVVAAPVVDGLEPPPAAAPASAPAAQPAKASKSSAEKKPAKFSHWYVGGGGSAPTGDMSSSTGIGFSGMLAYGKGMSQITQLRLGGAGNYWSVSSLDATVYDITGTFDLLLGKRIPSFIAPYGLIGGVGGVRNVSPPPGFVGYTRNPLYGGRVGGGLNSRRIFVEVSYQKVWVDGTTSGYVPFVFGFRF